jgi:hypothetical protein
VRSLNISSAKLKIVEHPGYGHDFLSHSADNEPRFIEVKCVAKVSDAVSSCQIPNISRS